MPSPDTVQHREASARRDCHYSAQRSDRMCSTAESPSAVRIASCRCSWPGPPAILSGRATGQSNPLQQRTVKVPYLDTMFEKPKLSEPDSSEIAIGIRRRIVARPFNEFALKRGIDMCV